MDRRIVTHQEAVKMFCPVTSRGFINNCRGNACMHWVSIKWPSDTLSFTLQPQDMEKNFQQQQERIANEVALAESLGSCSAYK